MAETAFSAAPALPAWITEQFPYARRVFHNGAHSIHFVDEGSGPAVLLQHGNPMWSYLWRRVMARLIPGGVRVIAPDLVGLGLSSKPRDPSIHTLEFHANQISALVGALQLDSVVIVGQDWGGPILGLLAARHPQWVRGAVFANTMLAQPTRQPRTTSFHRFANMPVVSDIAFRHLLFPIPVLHKVQGDPHSIGRREKKAYRFPLRDRSDRVAPLAFARMVPLDLAHPTVRTLGEVDAWARNFAGPVRLVWGMRDPILGPSLKKMKKLFPAAPVTETDAGHFLQEEVPMLLAEAILKVL
ncbi:MAG: alpha/beta fold hydrolase [Gammaproteobacteria bacterium]|nr:alpha/beta fold hydrolase [Gammaproteobacteria bacterium]NNF60851.1 alpha/beta fold hydrolase [Gammaproteobacteria bacterium]